MRTFIDIGSHTGEEIEWALDHGYEVHAFEPNPHLRDKLIERFGDNPNCKINFAAAWNEDGESELYLQDDREGNSSEMGVSLIREKMNVLRKNVLVQTVNIGKYISNLERDIDIIKIDAEGAEYIIIESILDWIGPYKIKNWWVEDHSQYIYNWHDRRKEILERLEREKIIIQPWINIKNNEELLG